MKVSFHCGAAENLVEAFRFICMSDAALKLFVASSIFLFVLLLLFILLNSNSLLGTRFPFTEPVKFLFLKYGKLSFIASGKLGVKFCINCLKSIYPFLLESMFLITDMTSFGVASISISFTLFAKS